MELILNGYCRRCDGARMVFADGEEKAADCGFPECPHASECEIAARLRLEFAKNEG